MYWWREEEPFLFWRFSILPFQSYWTWYDGKFMLAYAMITLTVLNFIRCPSEFMLTIFTFAVPELLVSVCHLSSVSVFLKFYQQLMKRGGSLSFTIFTFAVPELLDLIWWEIGFLPYSYDNLSSVSQNVLKFYQLKRGGSLSFWTIFFASRVIGLDWLGFLP